VTDESEDGEVDGAGGPDPETSRVCVVGAGAVGGLVGARMAMSGVDVTLLDRGPHLAAMQDAGGPLVVDRDGARERVEDLRVTGDPGSAGRHDVVFLAVKTYDLPEAAESVPPVMGDDAVVVPLQNGIPWWYFYRSPGPYEGRRLESLDPDGRIAEHIDASRVLGCVPYVASELPEPGVIRHHEGKWFPVGEPDGRESERGAHVRDLFERGGFGSRVLPDIRSEIWLKAWGSLAFNPISVLTRATLGEICRDPGTRGVARGMMEEAQAVAEALGASFRRSIDRRIEGAEAVGDHKTSMLQDLEAGHRLELEGLVGSVLELARLTGQPAPRIRTVYALVDLLISKGSGSS